MRSYLKADLELALAARLSREQVQIDAAPKAYTKAYREWAKYAKAEVRKNVASFVFRHNANLSTSRDNSGESIERSWEIMFRRLAPPSVPYTNSHVLTRIKQAQVRLAETPPSKAGTVRIAYNDPIISMVGNVVAVEPPKKRASNVVAIS